MGGRTLEEVEALSKSVTITGTRSSEKDDLAPIFAEYLGPFARAGAGFYLGGAMGVDSLALLWLARYTPAPLTVVVPCTIEDQPRDAVQALVRCQCLGRVEGVIELRAPALNAGAYYARNRTMVDRSDCVIGFPRQDTAKGGTWYTLNYAAQQGKPRLIVPL